MADQTFPVGTRVRHIDQMPPVDGRLLPMHGTVVAIEMRYIVEWDRPASDSPLLFGEQSTFKYPAEVLAAETPEEEMSVHRSRLTAGGGIVCAHCGAFAYGRPYCSTCATLSPAGKPTLSTECDCPYPDPRYEDRHRGCPIHGDDSGFIWLRSEEQ